MEEKIVGIIKIIVVFNFAEIPRVVLTQGTEGEDDGEYEDEESSERYENRSGE